MSLALAVGLMIPPKQAKKGPWHSGDLAEKVLDWPGVNSAAALLEGKSLKGHWIDRPRQYAARNRGEDASDKRFAVEETVVLSPLPCWAHLSLEQYRQRIQTLVAQVPTAAEP